MAVILWIHIRIIMEIQAVRAIIQDNVVIIRGTVTVKNRKIEKSS